MAASKSLHFPATWFSYCETEIKLVTLGGVHPVTAMGGGHGRVHQWWYSVWRQNDGGTGTKHGAVQGERMKLRLENNIFQQ